MIQQIKIKEEEIEPNYVCESCGHTLEPLKCKLICKRCGYFRSCSDLF